MNTFTPADRHFCGSMASGGWALAGLTRRHASRISAQTRIARDHAHPITYLHAHIKYMLIYYSCVTCATCAPGGITCSWGLRRGVRTGPCHLGCSRNAHMPFSSQRTPSPPHFKVHSGCICPEAVLCAVRGPRAQCILRAPCFFALTTLTPVRPVRTCCQPHLPRLQLGSPVHACVHACSI